MNKLDSIADDKSIGRFIDRSFDISDRIHEILQRKGISQRELAGLLNKNESQISKWLSGTHNFTIKTITQIEVAMEEVIMTIQSDGPSDSLLETVNKAASPDPVHYETV